MKDLIGGGELNKAKPTKLRIKAEKKKKVATAKSRKFMKKNLGSSGKLDMFDDDRSDVRSVRSKRSRVMKNA